MVQIDSIKDKTIKGTYTDNKNGKDLLKTVLQSIIKSHFGIDNPSDFYFWFSQSVSKQDNGGQKEFKYTCKY